MESYINKCYNCQEIHRQRKYKTLYENNLFVLYYLITFLFQKELCSKSNKHYAAIFLTLPLIKLYFTDIRTRFKLRQAKQIKPKSTKTQKRSESLCYIDHFNNFSFHNFCFLNFEFINLLLYFFNFI